MEHRTEKSYKNAPNGGGGGGQFSLKLMSMYPLQEKNVERGGGEHL